MTEEKFAWQAQKYHGIREWEVELPARKTPEWYELVAILFNRPDLEADWWPTEMVVSGLINEAEAGGGLEYPGYRYFDQATGEIKVHVLARARLITASKETIFDPENWQWALEPTDYELERSPELTAARALERLNDISDDLSRENSLRNIVAQLSKHLSDNYGS